MEYVNGTPVVEYCRSRKLLTEQRLRLFQTICRAVEYAHTQLVVHRDIKPANILVTGDGRFEAARFRNRKVDRRARDESSSSACYGKPLNA
jgi:serine/threonine protein kinase